MATAPAPGTATSASLFATNKPTFGNYGSNNGYLITDYPTLLTQLGMKSAGKGNGSTTGIRAGTSITAENNTNGTVSGVPAHSATLSAAPLSTTTGDTFTAITNTNCANLSDPNVFNAAICQGSVSPTATIAPTPGASLSVTKTYSINNTDPTTYSQVGQLITYAFSVTNTGSIPLTTVTLSDPSLPSLVATCAGNLAPTTSEDCTVTSGNTHTVTLNDFYVGSVSNTVTATGTPSAGPPVQATSTAVAYPQENQICGGTTITTSGSDGGPTDGTVTAHITLVNVPNTSGCKNYTYFNASQSTTNGDDVTFLSQQVHGAHVTASFVWGYVGLCDPNAPGDGSTQSPCPVTYVDFGSGLQKQTFCAAADPNGVTTPLWCTTSRTYARQDRRRRPRHRDHRDVGRLRGHRLPFPLTGKGGPSALGEDHETDDRQFTGEEVGLLARAPLIEAVGQGQEYQQVEGRPECPRPVHSGPEQGEGTLR